jgi:uncharacterized protein YqgC (DUF456 family)
MSVWSVVIACVMAVATVISFIPFVPGPALVWAIGVVYAIATKFSDISIQAVVVMTVLMLIGSTADWWTRLLGLGSEGKLTCGTFVVSTVGAILGTIFSPIPLVGTLLGAAGAVAVLVWYQEDDWNKAFKAARGIMSAWIASFFVEFIISVGITTTFIQSLRNVCWL